MSVTEDSRSCDNSPGAGAQSAPAPVPPVPPATPVPPVHAVDRPSILPQIDAGTRLTPQFDRLLILAAILALVSLYLPWLPGLYGAVPGWKVPYSTPDISLDEIRHLETVVRPESLFIINLVGIAILAFCRTSRHAGMRDLVAGVLLVAGGGYVLIYFAREWGWCLLYNYVGPYAAFTSLGLVVASGLLRVKFMPWIRPADLLKVIAAAFLITGFFLPWSMDHTGMELMLVARHFYWLVGSEASAWVMPIFPLLGAAAFATAFWRPVWTRMRVIRYWPIYLGLAALVYFHSIWATYLIGFQIGSWGTLAGLTILTAAGITEALDSRPYIARFAVWTFVVASAAVWFSQLTGNLGGVLREFFNVPPPINM